MQIRPVDPRDQTNAIEAPVYRVYFWERPPDASDRPARGRLYTSYEYELVGCRNVREAIAWADESAGPSRSYTLYVAVPLAGITLVRLFGLDPTQGNGEPRLDWPGDDS